MYDTLWKQSRLHAACQAQATGTKLDDQGCKDPTDVVDAQGVGMPDLIICLLMCSHCSWIMLVDRVPLGCRSRKLV